MGCREKDCEGPTILYNEKDFSQMATVHSRDNRSTKRHSLGSNDVRVGNKDRGDDGGGGECATPQSM